MSSTAIKDVTHMLRRLLEVAIKGSGFQKPKVTTFPPSTDLPNEHGANLYLYRVVESPFTKNQNWRGDRTPTLPSSRPALGLQLFYLITPLSKKETIDGDDTNRGEEAHSILGAIMLALQENPILNDVHLFPDLDADTELPESILNSYEQVKVTLLPTDVNELSKIWATINQPYRLSVAYEVSLVELTPTPLPSSHGGIVLSTGVKVITLDRPRLTDLTPATGPLVKMLPDKTLQAVDLTIAGFGLRFPGQTPMVRIGGKPVALKEELNPSEQSLSVTLPTDVDAGPQVDVRVALNNRTSTPLTFAVTPWLTGTKPIRTTLEKDSLGNDQKLDFTGNGFGETPQAVRFEGPIDGASEVSTVGLFEPGGTDIKASITIPTDLKNGLYEVRLVTGDGSASNKRTLEVMPLVSKVEPKVVGDVHQLTVTGARLDGKNIRFFLDGATYVAPENTTSDKFVFKLGRKLNEGSHRITLSIDGHASRPIDFKVT